MFCASNIYCLANGHYMKVHLVWSLSWCIELYAVINILLLYIWLQNTLSKIQKTLSQNQIQYPKLGLREGVRNIFMNLSEKGESSHPLQIILVTKKFRDRSQICLQTNCREKFADLEGIPPCTDGFCKNVFDTLLSLRLQPSMRWFLCNVFQGISNAKEFFRALIERI